MKRVFFLLIVAILSSALRLLAGTEKSESPVVRGVAIATGPVITLEDPYFTNSSAGHTNVSSNTLITFGIDHDKLPMLSSSVSAEVNVRITYYTSQSAPATYYPSATGTVPLVIEQNPASNSKDLDVLRIKNAYKVIVEIIGSPKLNEVAASLPDYVFIKAVLEVERYYAFDTKIIPVSLNLNHTYNQTTNELTFTWTKLPGAEYYDLEYTYLDDYSSVGVTNKKPLSDLTYDFKNNSTRISTDKISYTIPYVYDRGYILYRVRGVGKGGDNFKNNLPGLWSSDGFTSTSDFIHFFPKSNEQLNYENTNWQFSSSFAEEGKRKDVKSYFDGSLRNRQAVTKTNTDHNLIVAETIYDYIGRPAVQIIPTPAVDPSVSKSIAYVSSYNQNLSGANYSKKDFDFDVNCTTNTGALKTDKGASLYYSPNNPDKSGANAYIPDAAGRPFTQVEYEPDNTGRIRRQSGLGPDFKLGSGHETQYFYGQPEQEQLDRLFGSEAGYSLRYSKNVVIDGNGQASVSYLDPADRIVATALSGEKPDNLEELSGVFAKTMTINMIEKCPETNKECAKNNSNKIIGNALEVSKELVVTSPGIFTFNYSMTGEELNYACHNNGASGEVCYDCVYDLELEIRDKCGDLAKDDNGDIVQPVKKVLGSLETLDNTCSPPITDSEVLTCKLGVGSYTLLKRLTVNAESIEKYASLHVQNCTYTEEEINVKVTVEKEELKASGYACDEMDCKQCQLNLDAQFDKFKALEENKGRSEDELKLIYKYQEAKDECKDLCEPESMCQAGYQMMLSDLAPAGQYGATDSNSDGWALSVFNIKNALPKNGNGHGNYKYPISNYVDAAGNESYVAIEVTTAEAEGSAPPEVIYAPEIIDPIYLIWAVKDVLGVAKEISESEADGNLNAFRAVRPQHLKNLDDFVSNWEASWTQSMEVFHPEYCYYEWCIVNSTLTGVFNYTSEDFDDRLQIIGSWTDALTPQAEKVTNTNGALTDNPLYDIKFPDALMSVADATDLNNIDFLLNKDPFFSAGGQGELMWQKMHDRLSAYARSSTGIAISLKEFVAIANRCESRYHSLPTDPCKAFGTDFYLGTTDPSKKEVNEQIKDSEWEMYRNSYLSERQKIQRFMADQYCSAKNNLDGGFNGCIGNNKFNPRANRADIGFFSGFWHPTLTRSQPCSWNFYRLYKNKAKRFSSEEDYAEKLNICDSGDPMAGVRAAKAKADLEAYMATGQCPIVSGLEFFVDAIASGGKLSTSSPEPLGDYRTFSQTLYDLLKYGEEKPIDWIDNSPYTEFSWSATVDGSGLTATITPKLKDCNEIHFDLPETYFDNNGAPIRITFDNLTRLRNLIYLKTTTNGNEFRVTATAEVFEQPGGAKLGEQNLELTGYTCLPINQCPDFSRVCEESFETFDLENLLSAFAEFEKGDDGKSYNALNATEQSLSDDKYSGDLTVNLKKYLGASATGSWKFDASGKNPIIIKIYDDNASDPEMLITLIPKQGIISANNILAFSCIKGVSVSSSTFKITGWHDDDVNDENYSNLRAIPFDGNVTVKDRFFQVFKCGPPVPSSCKSVANDNTGNLEEFLNTLVGSSTTTSNTIFINGVTRDISDIPVYVNSLQDQLTELPNTLGPVLITDENKDVNDKGATLTANFSNISGGIFTSTGCALKLYFPHKDADASFSNIIGFKGLKPDNSSSSREKNTFVVTAIYQSGTQTYEVLLSGETCFPIALCEFNCMAGTSIESHLPNGNFKNGTILNTNSGVGFSTDHTLTAGTIASGQATLVYDAQTINPDWRGRDHSLGHRKYFLAVNGEAGKRAWYTHVSVNAGQKYRFSAFFKALSASCSGITISMYGSHMPEGCITADVNVDFNISLHNVPYEKWESLSLGEPWVATFTGDMEIGILVKPNAKGCYEFGIDDIAFDGINVCIPSFTIFPDYPEAGDPQAKTPCEEHLDDIALENVLIDIERETLEKTENIKKAYIAKCLQAAETFYYSYVEKEYHYTLYYYDQSGNLIKTMPPSGVRPLSNSADLAAVKEDRKNVVLSPTVKPLHIEELATRYEYNALNQLVKQNTPDGGTSKFWYDKLGRLVLSQNAKQVTYTPKGYSYTKYDALGRIVEVGEVLSSVDISTIQQVDEATFNNLVNAGTRREITRTYYDLPLAGLSIEGFEQERLRKRVASVTYQDAEGSACSHATHYSYDIHGNVKTLIQDYPELEKFGQRYKRMDYDYDLISGKVNQFSYQAGQTDQFYHKYEYDADNRITKVFTSKDNVLWDNDATYNYYAHGPLARTELGDQKVQGMDYAYTLQGWFKGVNSNTLQANNDIGKDGDPAGQRKAFARDAVGYSLGYYNSDYTPIGTIDASSHFLARRNLDDDSETSPELFNGNISHMVTTLTDPTNGTVKPQLTAYRYDQLNRIKQMKTYQSLDLPTNTWTGASTDKYKNNISYDGNGNILTMDVNDDQAAAMDRMTYQYDWVDPTDKAKGIKSNRLLHVNDAVATTYTEDIEDQGVFYAANPASWNYAYDAIGNIIRDKKEEIAQIEWTVCGKVKRVTRIATSLKDDVEFAYNATGNRVMKLVKPRDGNGLKNEDLWKYTYYIRDGSGNDVAIYEVQTSSQGNDIYSSTFKASEYQLYGSSRLGSYTPNKTVVTYNFTASIIGGRFNNITNATNTLATDDEVKAFRLTGIKNYELPNHLGNVLSVISDRKFGRDDGTYDANGLKVSSTPDGIIDYYLSDIRSTSDYYPFGMMMGGRGYSPDGYRFGFNGKEKDNEGGNLYDYGFRIYNPKIAKFLSVDPLTQSYPMLTPYQFASNMPIVAIDLDGLEAELYMYARAGLYGETVQKVVTGVEDGVSTSLTNTVNFLRRDAWKAETWKQAGLFAEEVILSSSPFINPNTPKLDAAVKSLEDNVINGDAYSRSKFIGQFGTDVLTAYAGSKGLGNLKNFVVAKYMSGTFIIGSKTLMKVTAHLEQFGLHVENTIMLERMRKIASKEMKATEIDINFAKHELREAELMKDGKMLYEEAHEAVLKEQNMYHKEYEKKLYTQEALEAGNKAELEKVN